MFLFVFRAAHPERGTTGCGKNDGGTVIRLKARKKGRNACMKLTKHHMSNIKNNGNCPKSNRERITAQKIMMFAELEKINERPGEY